MPAVGKKERMPDHSLVSQKERTAGHALADPDAPR